MANLLCGEADGIGGFQVVGLDSSYKIKGRRYFCVLRDQSALRPNPAETMFNLTPQMVLLFLVFSSET